MDQLLKSLDDRGMRESELKSNLQDSLEEITMSYYLRQKYEKEGGGKNFFDYVNKYARN